MQRFIPYRSPEKIQLESLIKSIMSCKASLIAHLAQRNFPDNIEIENLPGDIYRSIEVLKKQLPALKNHFANAITIKSNNSFFCCFRKSKMTMSSQALLDVFDAEFNRSNSKLKPMLTPSEYKNYVDNSINAPLARSGECIIF